ncbi:hypothetical protein AV650_28020 (plasmid) [Serratia fonticola]|uniref:LPD7 domain-containing protein n=1 Tax=Serratia sp. 14-2641 TaxID=1841657 RepID=UPI000742DCC9|nr:LPD7 domain-containing protein [Serratia sp. 14-2641]ALX97413.1 hypothetical protein AV650_28020 [Serratia fonticola]OCJ33671.1 hypothetical protein A6U95_26135 [Serratia sp. 14-2641]
MQKRTYLTITRDNKKDAIRAAGRLPSGGYPLEYDRSEKLWFAVADADLEKVKAWLPAHTVTDLNRTITDNLTPAEEFAQVLKDAGFILPGNELPEMDGKRHRVATEDDKPGATSGVYQGFLDGRPAGWYQDHRASEGKVNWTSTGSHTYDPAEAIKQRALAAQKRWDREMQSQVEFTQIGKKLTQQWSKMPPAPASHPYLSRKGVPATEGVRLDKYDNLVIPLRNSGGDIRTLQYIKPDGTKNLKKGAEKTGNFFVVGGSLSASQPILYAEGYATAASLHMATGIPVVMTVDAGNMVTVSRKLKEQYPDAAHIILGEDDFTKSDNKGLNKAQEAAKAIDGTYIIPQFTDGERAQAFSGTASFSDFNDIHASRGLDAVRDQLAPVLDPLLPHWRQTFSEENTMPDTNHLQDTPADRQPNAVAMTDNNVTQTVTDAAPILPQEPIPIPAEEKPVSEVIASPLSEPQIPVQQLPESNTVQAEVISPLAEPTPSAGQEVPEQQTPLPQQPENGTTQAEIIPPLPDPVQQPAQPLPAPSDSAAPSGNPAPGTKSENGFNFTFGRLPGDVSPPESSVTPINLDELLQGLTSRQDGQTWVYALNGEDAFRDYGDRIVMATPQASENDRMILAALLSAKANQRGAVEITGSDDFIQRTLTLIVDHNIDVHLKNPQQREQFGALLKARTENATQQNGLNIGTADTAAGPAPTATQPAPGEKSPTPDATIPAQSSGPVVSPMEAPVNSGAAVHPAAPELSIPERESLRTGLTGKLLDAGKAPYQFDKNNTDSFYLQLRTKTGNKTFWGVELEQALKDSGKQAGDMVKLQYLGKKPITINVPVANDDGTVTRYERLETHRNHWAVTPAADNRLLVADKNAVAPAALSAYDGNVFWQLQQQIVQSAQLSVSVPKAIGHGLLYTGPDGKGHVAPETPPADAPVPEHSKAAGSVVMQALTADGEMLAHLAKGHGDYLQGVVRHEGQLHNVLARICTGDNGHTFLALNAVQDNGSPQLIGHASAVNSLKNGIPSYDTFAFQMKGADAPKFAVPLVSPEKIPPALHSKLGFSQAYTPPKAEEPVQAPRAQVKPAQPQPM